MVVDAVDKERVDNLEQANQELERLRKQIDRLQAELNDAQREAEVRTSSSSAYCSPVLDVGLPQGTPQDPISRISLSVKAAKHLQRAIGSHITKILLKIITFDICIPGIETAKRLGFLRKRQTVARTRECQGTLQSTEKGTFMPYFFLNGI